MRKREINTSFLCSPDLAICILFLKPGGMYASTRIRRDQARVEKPHRRATPKQIINQTVVSEAPNQHARLLVLERQAQLKTSSITQLSTKRTHAISLQAQGLHVRLDSQCDPFLRKQLFALSLKVFLETALSSEDGSRFKD